MMSATSVIAVSPFTRRSVGRPSGSDPRSWPFGEEGIADPQRDPALSHGAKSFRMQNLRSKMRQFGCLAVRDFRDRGRARHQTRVGGHQAVHVRPDDHLICVECRAQNRRGIV